MSELIACKLVYCVSQDQHNHCLEGATPSLL